MNRKALHQISYGLYIVCSKREHRFNGQISNVVVQVASTPPLVATSVHKQNLTHEYIQSSGVFTVSILSQSAPLKLIGRFGFRSGRDVDKFAGINYKLDPSGVPIVTDHAIAYLEVKVTNQLDAGTHTLFIGEVVNAEILTQDKPMTYDYYHEVKHGTHPETAPTYYKETKSTGSPGSKQDDKTARYWCTLCSYIYDPTIGDPESNISPGTAFKDLPDDWVCPMCDAPKDKFLKES